MDAPEYSHRDPAEPGTDFWYRLRNISARAAVEAAAASSIYAVVWAKEVTVIDVPFMIGVMEAGGASALAFEVLGRSVLGWSYRRVHDFANKRQAISERTAKRAGQNTTQQ